MFYTETSMIGNTDTIELHLSGLNGTVRHPDMQKIRVIGFFLKKWDTLPVRSGEKNFYKRLF